MTELILKANKLGKKLEYFLFTENWKDIGSIKDFNLANKKQK